MKYLLICLSLYFFIFNSIDAKIFTYSEVQLMAKDSLMDFNTDLIDLKMGDINEFCPNYLTLSINEKLNVFTHLIAAVSMFESDFNSDEVFKENNGNLSTGLLQISYDSIANIYKKNGCVNISSTEDLKDPLKNINCGYAIIKTLVKSSGQLAKNNSEGASAYWSSLRTPYTIYIKSINKTVTIGKKDQIINILKNKVSVCY